MSGSVTTYTISNATQTLGVAGTFVINGTGDTLYAGAGATVIENGDNASLTVYGDGVTIALNGAGDSVNAIGTQQTVYVAGANGTVVLSGPDGSAYALISTAGTSLDLYGTGDVAYVAGSGNFGNALGANQTVVVSGAYSTANAFGSATGTSLDLYGTGDVARVAGSGDVGNALGAGQTVEVDGAYSTANAFGSATGTSLNLYGTGDVARVAGSGDVGNALGASQTVEVDGAYSTANAFGSATGTSLNLYGTGDVANVAGSGNFGNALGAGQTVTVTGAYSTGNSFASAAGTVLTLYGAGDDANVAGTGGTISAVGAGSAVTVTGNGNGIVLGQAGSALDIAGGTGNYALANGDTVSVAGGAGFSVSGSDDTVLLGAAACLGILAGTGDTVSGDDAGSVVTMLGGTGATVNGAGGTVGLVGSGVTVTTSNETVNTLGGVTNVTVNGSGNTVNLGGANEAVAVNGNLDTVASAYGGDTAGFNGIGGTAQLSNGLVTLNSAGAGVVVAGNGDNAYSALSGTTVGFVGTNDTANVANATVFANGTATSGFGLQIQQDGDTLTTIAGSTSASAALTAASAADIGAIDDMVLGRDAGAADLAAAQVVLANGGTMNGVLTAVANSAEAYADMSATYAAAGGAWQGLVDAQAQSAVDLADYDVESQTTLAPSAGEFAGFADAMSGSYGAPIELFSVDPLSGGQTVLADTGIGGLLAELPALETVAGGATLGLQLADGTQVQFASTGRLATWLYSVAVQQGVATSFVTDNYNLDMQWLNTVDQPLLEEAAFWSARAKAEAAGNPEAAVEDNAQAGMATQIAAEAPSSRQSMTVTIANAATGNPTQITVYAGGGSRIHDVAPTALSYVQEAVTTIANIGAVLFPELGLGLVAVALDDVQAGQDFANGQDLQGLLSLAPEISGDLNALGLTETAQVVSAVAQGVGGVYGAVQASEQGNLLGILAGALQAGAAAANGAGIGQDVGTQQTLSTVATALQGASVAANVASDFKSGNIVQGLLDSLSLYLPQESQAEEQFLSAEDALQGVSQTDPLAFAASSVNAGGNSNGLVGPVAPTALDPSDSVGLTTTVGGQTATTTVGVVTTASGGKALGVSEQPSPSDTHQTILNLSLGLPTTIWQPQPLATSALFTFISAEGDANLADAAASAPLPPTVAVVDAKGNEDLLTLEADISKAIGDTLVGAATTVGSAVQQTVTGLASQLAAEVVIDLSGPHGYIFQEGMQFITAEAASQYMLNYPGPGANYVAQGGVHNQDVSMLIGNNPIKTFVDDDGMHIQNVTLPDHIFDPGTVDRYVTLNPNGTYSIVDFGKGTGLLPIFNDYAPYALFGNPIANAVNGHITLIH